MWIEDDYGGYINTALAVRAVKSGHDYLWLDKNGDQIARSSYTPKTGTVVPNTSPVAVFAFYEEDGNVLWDELPVIAWHLDDSHFVEPICPVGITHEVAGYDAYCLIIGSRFVFDGGATVRHSIDEAKQQARDEAESRRRTKAYRAEVEAKKQAAITKIAD